MMHIGAKPLASSRAFPIFSKPPNPTRPAEALATRVMGGGAAQRWLLKTEPHEWSWSDQAANGGVSNWDGVRNKQAQKNMKSMKVGDLCFFYHSGSKARCVVGVVEVVKEWYEDGGGGAVDVREVGEMRRRVGLEEMKRDEGLKGFEMFRQPRLSVVRVSEEVWVRVCEIGGGFVGDGRVDEGDLEGEVDEAGDPSS